MNLFPLSSGFYCSCPAAAAVGFKLRLRVVSIRREWKFQERPPKLKEELWENTDKDGDAQASSPFSAPDGHKNKLFFPHICLIKTDAAHKIL